MQKIPVPVQKSMAVQNPYAKQANATIPDMGPASIGRMARNMKQLMSEKISVYELSPTLDG